MMAVMIFTLDLGIAGAAWATSISSLCSVLLIYYWYYTGKTSLRLRIIRRPEKSSVKEILSIAIPRAMEEFSSGVFLLLQRVIIMMVAGSAAVIMMLVTVIQYRRFDIDSLEPES